MLPNNQLVSGLLFSKLMADRRGLEMSSSELLKSSLFFGSGTNPALGLVLADERIKDKAALAAKAKVPPPPPLTNPEKERLKLLESGVKQLEKLYRANCLNEKEAFPILKKLNPKLSALKK